MSKPSPARYSMTNWSSYTASLRKPGSLLIWLNKEMTWFAPLDGKPGRPAVFCDPAIQFCLTAARQGIAQQRPERGSKYCSSCRYSAHSIAPKRKALQTVHHVFF